MVKIFKKCLFKYNEKNKIQQREKRFEGKAVKVD